MSFEQSKGREGVVLNQRKSVRFALIKLLPPRSRTLIETR